MMIIRSKVSTNIGDVEIKPGVNHCKLNHKEKLVAEQLKVLKDEGKIMFDEILDLDRIEAAEKKIAEGEAELAEVEQDKKDDEKKPKPEEKKEVKADVRKSDKEVKRSY